MKYRLIRASTRPDPLGLGGVGIRTAHGPVGFSLFGEDEMGRPVYGIGYGQCDKDRAALLFGLGAARRIADRLGLLPKP